MRAWWMLLACSCGRIDFDASRSDAPPSVAVGPFSSGVEIMELATATDNDDPTISGDGLELYFASVLAGDSEIMVSTRASLTDPWSPATQVMELASPSEDKGPELSDDDLALYYGSGSDIMVTTRASRTAAWSTPTVALATGASLGTPAVCDMGRRMFLRTDFGSTEDIYMSTRVTTSDAWSAPTIVSELDLGTNDSGPWPSADCTRLYFDSDVSGRSRIYVTHLDTATGAYAPPTELTELMSGSIHDATLTSDERMLIFSHRSGSFEQLYQASR